MNVEVKLGRRQRSHSCSINFQMLGLGSFGTRYDRGEWSANKGILMLCLSVEKRSGTAADSHLEGWLLMASFCHKIVKKDVGI